ncbi:hypothetical protein FRC05_002480 [Tulasnella sp. 425]|nr:hypothetical protein FRC05_002480 [Tulasnella sp. 425]
MSQYSGSSRGGSRGGRGRGGGDTRGRGGGPPSGRGTAFQTAGPAGRGGAPSRGGPPAAGPPQQQQFPGADRGRGRGRGGFPPGPRGGAPAQSTPSGPSGVQPTPTQVAIAPHVKALGVKRPAFGTRGNSILLDINAFETKIPEGLIYHYTEFSPQAGSKPLKMELFRKVQALPEFLQASHGKKGVYDSDNQFFSTVSLGDNCQFQLQDRRKTYSVRLTQVATINPQILVEYVQGQREREDHVTTVLTAFNVAIRMGLMEKFPLYNRNSFFIREAEVRGFKDRKSIRPVMGKMIINIDVSTGVVVKGGPLIAMALQFFKQPVNNVQFLANLNPRDKTALERFLRGVKFVTNDAPDARPSSIKNLTSASAEQYKFKKDDGKEISIAQYNQQKGTPLRYPKLPCVEKIGMSKAVYPMEHCIVRAQLLPKQVESDQINDVLGFSTMKPHIRLQRIREGFQFLEYGQNEYLRDFGISIDPNPLRVQARVLHPPELQYSGKFERPQGGSWRTGKFFAAKEVKGWVIVNLSGNYPGLDVPRIAQDIRQSCTTQGMKWTNNPPISFARNPMSDPEVAIKEALAEHRKKGGDANLIIVIIPDEGKDLYYRIKHFGDVKLGIATQCLKASKCAKGGRDYSTNVSLKINAKLGGTNVVLKPTDAKFLSEQPVLILGADVMHSRAMGDEGLGRPSFAAVTGNIDMPGCRYVGVGRAQQTRQEMIQDLEGMVMQIIAEYKKANPGRRPFTSVLYFRDGVAENQFKTVIEDELPKIRSACAKSGIKTGIKLTCLIVGKRHHFRLFPADASSADRTGNAPPGTVLDSVITSPVDFDFYLQPHAGVHCNVLVDDNLFTPDDLQQLTFNLCHVYARSTRSVSLPAPVYYAHLVCSRANHRYDPKGNFSLDAPAQRSMGKEDAERRLQEFIKAFMPLHPNTQSVMYFQ